MADLTLKPVAQDIKPMPTMSLGEMINFARGAQQYQREGISLTLEQQQERERQAIQEFLSRPENFQTSGRVDINKLNAEIPRLAPLTGADWMNKYTTLSTAQTQASTAAQALTQSQREIIASRLAVMGRLGVNDKRAYMGELNQLIKENPNNRELASLVDAYKTTLQNVPEGADLPSLAISGANSLLSPAAQQQTFGPQAGTISTGAATFPTVTTPSVAGKAPTVTVGQQPLATAQLPPGSREVPTGQVDINNMPIVNVFGPNGEFLGQRAGTGTPGMGQLPGAQPPRPVGAPTMGPSGAAPTAPMAAPTTAMPSAAPVARMPPGETPQTLTEANQIRSSAANAAANVPTREYNNNQIIKLADAAITGKGAETIASMAGGMAFVPWTGDTATYFNELGHYLKMETALLAQTSGLSGTDAARATAEATVGSTGWTAPALKNVARLNRALATSTDLFNQGVQNAFAKSKDPFAARDFQNKWSQTMDINAVRLFDAMRNNDKEAIREVVGAVGGPNSPGYKRLVDNIGKMNQLIRGQ